MLRSNGFARLGHGLPWLALVLLLVVGTPLFLCMPLWADATLYDLAARNVRDGGVPYRDIFDTNLPGMVWLHLLVRHLLGERSEALRLADLFVYSGIVLLLLSWLRRGGQRLTACAWAAVALIAFYFSLSELCHCQRDTWMLLPALAALELRQRRLDAEEPGRASAFAEGALWAVAFWIKPFVAVPAVVCFLATPRRWPGAASAERVPLVAGGAIVLLVGLGWLGHVGAVPYLADVFLHWNPEYAGQSANLEQRTRFLCKAFLPWSLVHLVTVPLSVVLVVRGRHGGTGGRGWALPAAFYLGWLLQAAYLQKGYDYILASAAPPALALVAGRAWWPGPLRLGTALLLAFAVWAAARHPLVVPERLALWERCCHEGSSAELRDRLKRVATRNAPDWADLERVADFLRQRRARDAEVTCYNNSTHPLYLILDLRPSTRFLHYDTILMCFPSRREEVRQALKESGQRYVVSDRQALPGDEEPGRDEFPWSLPVLFRAGRYAVHEARAEVGPLVYR